MKTKSDNAKPKNHHVDHRLRMRKRFHELESLDSFATHEVLEMLLYGGIPFKDTNPIAHELLEKFGSLRDVIDASIEQLCDVPGMTYNAAVSLHLYHHLERFLAAEKSKTTLPILDTSDKAAKYLMPLLSPLKQEQILVLSLNKNYKLIKCDNLSRGNPDSTFFPMRAFSEVMVKRGGTSVILAHNHPSGNFAPSTTDFDTTREACRAANIIGVTLGDHIIIGSGGYYSFAKNGHIINKNSGGQAVRNTTVSLESEEMIRAYTSTWLEEDD